MPRAQSFRPIIYLPICVIKSLYRADRHASVNFVYDSERRRVPRREKEHNLVVPIGKSEAEVTNNRPKRLRLRHCTVDTLRVCQ